MFRFAIVTFSLLLASGCASVARLDVSAAEPSEAAQELECMADCLDEDDASCDDCAARCFAAHSSGVVLSLSR
jgi:outer membrane murein-binding lipoprotein Lpp